jgi:hypothetical protein
VKQFLLFTSKWERVEKKERMIEGWMLPWFINESYVLCPGKHCRYDLKCLILSAKNISCIFISGTIGKITIYNCLQPNTGQKRHCIYVKEFLKVALMLT